MKNRFLRVVYVFLALGLIFQSCDEDEGESHNAGQNCMTCHRTGGSGKGVFTLAGTVYDNSLSSVLPNASVRLYTESNGTGNLVVSVQADNKGNFYTSETIDFGSGLYVLVEGNTSTKNMTSSLTTGACNSCHGVSVDRIWAE